MFSSRMWLLATVTGSTGLRTFRLLQNVGQLQPSPWCDTHSLTLGRLLHAGFLSLSTIDILGQISLGCGGLSCAS